MRVAVTGTPGTGKTTATDRLETDLDVIHLNEVIEREGFSRGTDADRGSTIADLDAISEWFAGREDVLVESHLAHELPVDRVIVLRCHPETIEQRLMQRGESEASAAENAESEALDVILAEAVDAHGTDAVYEIETTDRSPPAVATEIDAVLGGEREPSAGTVSYVEYL
ncbi:MAG: adenylate kinase family protein [Halorhabdus sp.]